MVFSGVMLVFASADAGAAFAGSAPQPPEITVYKSPTCGCCEGWIGHLREQGFRVRPKDREDMRAIKSRHGVPAALESCHTSVVGGYVVEGHVPIEAVVKLRTERPDIKGIALPGMPSGTPGMPGPKFAPYEVKLLDGKLFMQI
jgi:hypothetical protein